MDLARISFFFKKAITPLIYILPRYINKLQTLLTSKGVEPLLHPRGKRNTHYRVRVLYLDHVDIEIMKPQSS